MKSTLKKNRFYVYALLDPRKPGKYKYGKYKFDYEPFYIGKGCGNRILHHTEKSNMKRNRNPHLNRKIKKLLDLNLLPINFKIIENLEEKRSLFLEKKIIKIIGRKNKGGILTNIDEGGGACPKMTAKIKRKLSNSRKEYYKKHEHPWTGKQHSMETKVKMCISRAKRGGQKHTKRDREKISKANKGREIYKMCNSYIFISPKGKEIIVDKGLDRFCKKYNLNKAIIHTLINGTRKNKVLKGWKFKKILKVNNSGIAKKYKLTDPNNKVHIIDNGLQKFCLKHGLQYINLIKVAKKERQHHKQWKCEYYAP